jgi:hypothetical protein
MTTLRENQLNDLRAIEWKLRSLRYNIAAKTPSECEFNHLLLNVMHDVIHVAEKYSTDVFTTTAEQMIDESITILLEKEHEDI